MEKLEKGAELPLKITSQGAVVVKTANIDNVLAVEVYTRTKRGDVGSFGRSHDRIPSIHVHDNDESIGIMEDKKGRYTEISFPALRGWDVFSATFNKNCVRICFTKNG